jgi:hypothetical protein
MTKFLMIVFAVTALAQSALAVAGDKSSSSHAAATSYVPQPHASSHVYGTPIQAPIVGHAKTYHLKAASKKRSSGTARKAR